MINILPANSGVTRLLLLVLMEHLSWGCMSGWPFTRHENDGNYPPWNDPSVNISCNSSGTVERLWLMFQKAAESFYVTGGPVHCRD